MNSEPFAVSATRTGKPFFSGISRPPRLVGENRGENHTYSIVSGGYDLSPVGDDIIISRNRRRSDTSKSMTPTGLLPPLQPSAAFCNLGQRPAKIKRGPSPLCPGGGTEFTPACSRPARDLLAIPYRSSYIEVVISASGRFSKERPESHSQPPRMRFGSALAVLRDLCVSVVIAVVVCPVGFRRAVSPPAPTPRSGCFKLRVLRDFA